MGSPLMPVINGLSRPFWTAAEAGRLVLPHCVETGQPFWPPSPSSPFRTAGKVKWRDVEASGTLLSIVVYRRPFQQELASALPYGIGLVEIEPGVRLFAYIARPDGGIAAGDPVRLDFRPLVAEGVPALVVAQEGVVKE